MVSKLIKVSISFVVFNYQLSALKQFEYDSHLSSYSVRHMGHNGIYCEIHLALFPKDGTFIVNVTETYLKRFNDKD